VALKPSSRLPGTVLVGLPPTYADWAVYGTLTPRLPGSQVLNFLDMLWNVGCGSLAWTGHSTGAAAGCTAETGLSFRTTLASCATSGKPHKPANLFPHLLSGERESDTQA
jgi:hypothetical protein